MEFKRRHDFLDIDPKEQRSVRSKDSVYLKTLQTALNCPILHIITVECIFIAGSSKSLSLYASTVSPGRFSPSGTNQYSLIITSNQARHIETDGD